MKSLSVKKISDIIGGEIIGSNNRVIDDFIFDSRKFNAARNKIFIALKGERHNGHDYIKSIVKQGVESFIISEFRKEFEDYSNCSFIICENTKIALQQIGKYAGEKFEGKIIAITGSNGKTSVKEWLFQLLRISHEIIRSPKSYNSQIGVPISMLLLDKQFDTAIIEAGISMPGEMDKLEKIIIPDIGIFTGIGDAHRENFESKEQKINEKLKLFKECKQLIYRNNNSLVNRLIEENLSKIKLFSWGENKNSNLLIRADAKKEKTTLLVKYKEKKYKYSINYTDKASIENVGHCLAYIFSQNEEENIPSENLLKLAPVKMRMEQIKGINNCTLINDSYNSDINSLSIALDLLKNQSRQERKTLILSDIQQCRRHKEKLYAEVAELIYESKIDRLIGIGKELIQFKSFFDTKLEKIFFESTDNFLKKYRASSFKDEAILIKGARTFTFERITEVLQLKSHRTQLLIKLEALVHNLNYFKSKILKKTKVMVMVKAFSYGSGSHQIASVLQHEQVDYLAVAITDEGVQLRKEGINLPILVLNPEVSSFDTIIEYNLEPEIYNFTLLDAFIKRSEMCTNNKPSVHIKIETGMNRLGFTQNQIVELLERLNSAKNIVVKSIFSHLSGSDSSEYDDYTKLQIDKFKKISSKIQNVLPYSVLLHILNSSGIERFSDAEFDMVRLGIGLYGFSLNNQDKLQNVSSLISSISQVRLIRAGESVGYSRMGKLTRDSRIAVVPIGYADGLRRSLSNGNWSFIINNQKAPVVGNICMDMTMIDITDIPAEEGDKVIIFGDEQTAGLMAEKLNTIPYEIITGIGERVKRVYCH